MFEISWSEILVIGIVALIVVGPKELPVLLRTVGKYMGMIKRQAAEFRAQFDEAMRESELDQIRKDMQSIKTDAEKSFRDTEEKFHSEMADVKRELDATTDSIKHDHAKHDVEHDQTSGADAALHDSTRHDSARHDLARHDANGLPMPATPVAESRIAATYSPPHVESAPAAGSAAIAAAAAAASSDTAREPAKTGA